MMTGNRDYIAKLCVTMTLPMTSSFGCRASRNANICLHNFACPRAIIRSFQLGPTKTLDPTGTQLMARGPV